MKDNISIEKSFEFAVRVVNLCKYLTQEKKEYILSKQLLRSGTSIGAKHYRGTKGPKQGRFCLKNEHCTKRSIRN